MTQVIAPTGGETHIRAIVFREDNMYVAQCLEYDIVSQASDLANLLERLHRTVEAEFAACVAAGKKAPECIGPAQPYYHGLWEKRSVALERIQVPTPLAHRRLHDSIPTFEIEAALAA